jgi:simple sugar transport system ATP-binding protein
MGFALELVGVTKHFGAVTALDGASLAVRAGTLHAVLGENGAGKTTLLRVAFGMLAPDGGEVRVDGVGRRFASPADALRDGVAMVHQHFTIVPAMTVAENVALGRSGRYERRPSACAAWRSRPASRSTPRRWPAG